MWLGYEYVVLDKDGVERVVEDSRSLLIKDIDESKYAKQFIYLMNKDKTKAYIRHKYG